MKTSYTYLLVNKTTGHIYAPAYYSRQEARNSKLPPEKILRIAVNEDGTVTTKFVR